MSRASEKDAPAVDACTRHVDVRLHADSPDAVGAQAICSYVADLTDRAGNTSSTAAVHIALGAILRAIAAGRTGAHGVSAVLR